MSKDTEWKTIRVPKDVYDDAKDRKEDHGVTWGQYVNPHAWHSVFDEPKSPPSGEAVAKPDASEHFLDDLEDNLTSVIDASQADIDEAVSQITGHIDDLEARLPRKVAEELEGRMG